VVLKPQKNKKERELKAGSALEDFKAAIGDIRALLLIIIIPSPNALAHASHHTTILSLSLAPVAVAVSRSLVC
jgi:hypothetical protein